MNLYTIRLWWCFIVFAALLHVFSLLSFHFGHGNKCKALRYTPFVTPSVRDCSLGLILQVAQCFLDLRNLPNKITESKAFLNGSQQLCCVVSTSCSCFFCSFSAAAAPPTSDTVNLSSLQEWQIPRTSLDIFRPYYAKCTVFAAFGGIYHGRIEVADGIFHSLQLLGYLTQEQDIQNSCSMLFQYPSVFAWKHLRIHENFGSACEEMFWRSKPSKSALSIEP